MAGGDADPFVGYGSLLQSCLNALPVECHEATTGFCYLPYMDRKSFGIVGKMARLPQACCQPIEDLRSMFPVRHKTESAGKFGAYGLLPSFHDLLTLRCLDEIDRLLQTLCGALSTGGLSPAPHIQGW